MLHDNTKLGEDANTLRLGYWVRASHALAQALVQLSDSATGVFVLQDFACHGRWFKFLTRLLGLGKTCPGTSACSTLRLSPGTGRWALGYVPVLLRGRSRVPVLSRGRSRRDCHHSLVHACPQLLLTSELLDVSARTKSIETTAQKKQTFKFPSLDNTPVPENKKDRFFICP